MARINADAEPLADGTIAYRPRVNATVAVGKKSAIYRALVDSGADKSMVSADLIAALGAKWEKLTDPQPELGAGGIFETRFCPGQIYFGGVLITNGFRVAPATHVNGLFISVFILGRADFFQKFIPTFHWEESPPWFDLSLATKK